MEEGRDHEEDEEEKREEYAELDRRTGEENALREKYAEEPVTKKQSVGVLAGGIILTIVGLVSAYANLVDWRPSGNLFNGVAFLLLFAGLFLLVAWWREGRAAF